MARPTELDPRYVNRRASLPYGLRVDEVEKAVSETYRLLHGVNDYLVGRGFSPWKRFSWAIRSLGSCLNFW